QGGWWKSSADASIPIGVDMAPWPQSVGQNPPVQLMFVQGFGTKAANSVNHQREGQVVVFGDAHAEFVRRPDVGQNNDNIWTIATNANMVQQGTQTVNGNTVGGAYTGLSAGAYDIVMCPVSDMSGNIRK